MRKARQRKGRSRRTELSDDQQSLRFLNGHNTASVRQNQIPTTTEVRATLLLLTKSKSRRKLVTTGSFQQEGPLGD